MYYFFIRPWNLNFFNELSHNILKTDSKAEFLVLTMHIWVKREIEEKGLKHLECIYLPHVIKESSDNEELARKIDLELQIKFKIGLNKLYSFERFATDDNPTSFINKHVSALNHIFSKKGIFISLSMDHFVIVLAGYMNRLIAGESFFIQPVGFPSNTSLIMKSPFEMHNYRKPDYESKRLKKFIASLEKRPEDTVHYMKSVIVENLNLSERIKRRLGISKEQFRRNQLLKHTNEFSYLDTVTFHKKTPFHWDTHQSVGFLPNRRVIALEELNDQKGKIFLFPLHLEPEMTIEMYSNLYRSQFELVRLISSNLNYGDILILKENPKQPLRSQFFYESIIKMSNVFWVSEGLNNRDLIRKSFKVVSLVGTALVEAILLKKPVLYTGSAPFSILLGKASNMMYNQFSNIHNILYSEEIVNIDSEEWSQLYFEYSASFFDGVFNIQQNHSLGQLAELVNYKDLANKFVKEVLHV